jgi:hypothetical protein
MIFGLLVAAGGVISLALGFAEQKKDLELSRWPAVAGQMEYCKIVESKNTRMRSSSQLSTARSDANLETVNVWTLEADYHYEINGKKYNGYRATSSSLAEQIDGSKSEPSKRLKSIMAQLKEGASVEVHHDPANPQESYVIYVPAPGIASLYKTGAALLVIGAGIVIASSIAWR